jgi:site-specific DNA recombinase
MSAALATATAPLRAAVYVRISEDTTDNGSAVERQTEDAREHVARRGWTVARSHTYCDNDLSANGKVDRPRFRAMVQAVWRGEIDVIVAWTQDRLLRNDRDKIALIEAVQARGVTVSYVRGGDLDPNTPLGEYIFDNLAAQAKLEIKMKGDRQRRAARQRRERGEMNTATRLPFGYAKVTNDKGKVTFRLVPKEADALKWAAEQMLSKGGTLREVARKFDELGLKPRQGERWHPTTISRILTNPRYCGLSIYRESEDADPVEYPGQWPAVFEVDVWRDLCRKLGDSSRRTARGIETLGGGTFLCQCGATVVGCRTRTGSLGYRCTRTGGGHVVRGHRELIDQTVTSLVLGRLAMPDAVELLRADESEGPEVARMRARATLLRERLVALGKQMSDPDVPLAMTKISIKDTTTELAELEERLAELTTPSPLRDLIGAPDITKAWESLGIDRRKDVIDTLVTVTLVSPGRGPRPFDPETVKITFR